ncbi:MAG: hypothetical protein GTO63_16430 [Anaerolineae bacterium]|nr:hypothetical protein [Anaerolineae bacterium]
MAKKTTHPTEAFLAALPHNQPLTVLEERDRLRRGRAITRDKIAMMK